MRTNTARADAWRAVTDQRKWMRDRGSTLSGYLVAYRGGQYSDEQIAAIYHADREHLDDLLGRAEHLDDLANGKDK